MTENTTASTHRIYGVCLQLTGLGIGALALWWLIHRMNIGPVCSTMQMVPWPVVVAALCLNLVSQVLRASGWWVLLGPALRLPLHRLVYYEVAAQAATSLTPEGSGEALRIWWLRREGVPAATTTAIIISKKLVSSLGLVPFALLVPLLVDLPTWIVWITAGYSSLFIILGGLLLCVVRQHRNSGRLTGPLGRFLAALLDGLAPLRRSGVVFAALGLACTTRATDIMAAWMLCNGLGVPDGAAAATLSLLLIEISNVLPTAPAQIGSFDVAAAMALGVIGSPPSVSVGFAALFHAQQLVPQLVVGLVPLFYVSRADGHRPHQEGAQQ
ncbi:lysylphosphatidylglycerol synthase transmembrane domain-containing protein [Austwickia chelonae]|uniref:lysylphosphatidylglycerol synthase transmembrane domain-containing protein n=1 Tax=Austwickia chelonae TaxID=100225 RepID=UPI0013C2F59C|nr:lysylphosphatidylglycerol synthase transmembrane domain-containing protein [Austwickia chelonae]